MSKTPKTYVVRPGDRLDIIAQRVYGNPFLYKLILQANPLLNIWNPEAGMKIAIPDARQSN